MRDCSKGVSGGTEAAPADPQHQMTTNATDETDAMVAGDDQAERYAELNIGDEEFVIYDRENHQAWIQSTMAVTAEDIR